MQQSPGQGQPPSGGNSQQRNAAFPGAKTQFEQFQGTQGNFTSNDTNILQRKLLALQAELSQLDTEYDSLVEENRQIRG